MANLSAFHLFVFRAIVLVNKNSIDHIFIYFSSQHSSHYIACIRYQGVGLFFFFFLFQYSLLIVVSVTLKFKLCTVVGVVASLVSVVVVVVVVSLI